MSYWTIDPSEVIEMLTLPVDAREEVIDLTDDWMEEVTYQTSNLDFNRIHRDNTNGGELL